MKKIMTMTNTPVDSKDNTQAATFSRLSLQWNQLALEAIIHTNTPPPAAARALAMVHTAMYDAWSVYNKCAFSTTTARYIKRLKENCPNEIRKTYSYAADRVLTHLFWLALPQNKRNMFRILMCECDYDPDDCSMDIKTAEGIGNLIARLIIDYRKGDGSNEQGMLYQFPPMSDYTRYLPLNPPYPAPVKDVSYWQALTINGKTQSFLTPHWSLVKPFALKSARQFRPDPPFNLRDHPHDFKRQVIEVIDISAGLTDRQKAIGEYWSDGPGTYAPPGHWCEIAQFVAIGKQYDDVACIKLFFALTNAMFDASIACWECKSKYDSARPVTVIRELYKFKKIMAWGGPGQGTVEMDGKNWMPYQVESFVTPPFAEHVSGHSNFSRAAATILSCFTGSDDFHGCIVIKKGSSLIEPGLTPVEDITLNWHSFTAAAEEAGMSRLYGGIHFRRANDLGQKLGEAVAMNAWDKAEYYFND